MHLRRPLIIGGCVLALALPTTAFADPLTGADRFTAAPSSAGLLDSSARPRAAEDASRVTVMVELADDPVAVVEATQQRKLDPSEKNALKAQIKRKQDALIAPVAAKGGTVQAQLQSAYNGVRVEIATKNVSQLAALPGVVAVHAVGRYELDNAVSVPYLGVPKVWQDTGFTGKGVKVAIIDTGIDYTHADFGGPGTPAAYDVAHAAEATAANPALFGPNAPRVKGGWDFVGDAYAAGETDPKPDANPLDCNGHGSHVAGTAGGSGVNADGTPYTGKYNAATASKDFRIGPGVAPQADLYALRVFGCTGSTDVVTEAIDWAVDHEMDVINMSLGSSYGRSTDPSAVAASNAVGAGVVVVASAGNSGNNPYLTGSPGTGAGVLSVAAVDSTKEFPGATLSFDGKTLAAVNANGAALPAGPYTIVNLVDDPATPENEALGCSVTAYAKNGISADPTAARQIAVTERGSCARAARGIFGQEAGADAVIMVNNAADYPPYEGPITENPDTGAPYVVTIPFLGVRQQDGPALRAAEGKPLTLAAKPLVNPGFTDYASFSSGGPRTGDSGVSPKVSAPGVSIASVAAGTGNGVAIMSGTSMAAPHITGVAALGVQAHPTWSAGDVAAAIVSTADAERVGNYRLTLGGAGTVDPAQVVGTSVIALGDAYSTKAGQVKDSVLSFGFAEPRSAFVGTKTVTLKNMGRKPVTYKVANQKSPQSRPATVTFNTSSVTVPAGGTAAVDVKLVVNANTVGSSLTGVGQHSFYEVSGNIAFTAAEPRVAGRDSDTDSASDSDKAGHGSRPGEVLHVPYLVVPRPAANVAVSLNGQINPRNGGVTATLTNSGGALAADADFYTWGLEDAADQKQPHVAGFDLRAAGVQSFDFGSADKLIVFALNVHDRWSNAATNEFDVLIDTNGDGNPDVIAFSYDSGLVRSGTPDGIAEVFLFNPVTGALTPSGFLSQAPTDSSTILLPVSASALGLTEAKGGQFSYQVVSYSGEDATLSDTMPGTATYNPWRKGIVDGVYVTVEPGKKKEVRLPINKDVYGGEMDADLYRGQNDKNSYRGQKTLGVMIVVLDNKSGASEALLVRGQK